jgi:hypothetical protein
MVIFYRGTLCAVKEAAMPILDNETKEFFT